MKEKLCHIVCFTNLNPWKLGILTLLSLSGPELVAKAKSQRKRERVEGEMKGISKEARDFKVHATMTIL